MALHRIALTGASGALGRNFLKLVDGPGFEVLCLLRQQSRPPMAQPNVRHARLDIEDQEQVSSLLAEFQPTCFIHTAAAGNQSPRPDWADLIRYNVDASVGYCRSAARIEGCRFIHVGTGLVYRDQGRPLAENDAIDPLHPYGASKAAGDILVRAVATELKIPTIVLRPFSFTGPGDDQDRLFPAILRAALEKQPVRLSPGGQRRDYSSIRDIAAALLASVHADIEPGLPKVYNLGSGTTETLKELIGTVIDTIGLDVDVQFGARDYAPHEPMWLVADTTAAKRDLGWYQRHGLVQAIRELIIDSFPGLLLTK